MVRRQAFRMADDHDTDRDPRQRILRAARDIVAEDGLGALSFDAVARRLGQSKQAILYWFPGKAQLLAGLFLPWLALEADCAAAALDDAPAGRAAAIAAFVRAVAGFHMDDLDRFRAMYLMPQTLGRRAADLRDPAILSRVHAVTDQLYGDLAARLDMADPMAARRQAVAIHSAVLGHVTMQGLAASLHDPLKHTPEALVDALIDAL